MIVQGFDLTLVLEKIGQHHFERIVLQFPDELLNICTEVYGVISGIVDDSCDVYIAADSTFGSSVDDISAAHVNSDLLIYFGSDMSASASIPVMVVPQRKEGNSDELKSVISQAAADQADIDPSKFLLVYDPSYQHLVKEAHSELSGLFGNDNIGTLPACADIENWIPENSMSVTDPLQKETVGGLLFPPAAVSAAQAVVYVGEKQEQLVSILLRLSGCNVTAINPADGLSVTSHSGVASKEYRERYVGVMRVEEASIIGIIVGSMGLSDTVMHALVSQIQALIHAAGKKSYCFVMGRLNEAKLCNFPEVDVYCLISNDDCSRIPAKTFHVPVVTPFELQLGLGAREWDTSYVTSAGSTCIFEASDSSEEASGSAGDAPFLGGVRFKEMLQKVREKWARSRSSSEGSDEGDGEDTHTSSATAAHSGERTVAMKAEDQVTVFSSPAAAYLASRDYQGMQVAVPEGQTVEVLPGTYGIATSYEHTTTTASQSSAADVAKEDVS